MKNWIQSFLGLDKLTESYLLNFENQKALTEQNKKLLAEIKYIKENPAKTEIRYISSTNDLSNVEDKEIHLPVLEEFSLAGKKENGMNFSLTEKDFISSDFFEVGQSQEGQYQLSSMMAGLASGGASFQAAAQSTKGLFQATISPDKLMTYKDGMVSSIVKGADGKVIQHAGFTQAGGSAFNPLLAIQFASILTGQYYFKGITSQLNKVLDKLDNLERMHHIEREAKMKYAFHQLQEYSNKSAFTIEDFVNLKQVAYDLQVIRNEYQTICKETIDSIIKFVHPENLEKEKIELVIDDANILERTLIGMKGGVSGAVDKVSSSGFGRSVKSFTNSVGKKITNSRGKVEKIDQKINELAPYYTFKSAITAEELYQISRLVELKMNLAVKEISSDRVAKISDLKEELSNFKKEGLLHTSLGKTVNEFRKVIFSRFEELKNESNIDKNDIQLLIKNSKKQFDILEEINRKSINTVRTLNLEAVQSFSKESEVLLDNRGAQPKLYIKAS